MYDLIFPKTLLSNNSCWSPWQQRTACMHTKMHRLNANRHNIFWQKSQTWGTDEVMHPSREFGKDYLEGKLHELWLVVQQPEWASTDMKQKTTSTKNLQNICRYLKSSCFTSVQSCSKSSRVKVMSHSCWKQQKKKLKVNQTVPELNALCQLYWSITDDMCLNLCVVTMHVFKH